MTDAMVLREERAMAAARRMTFPPPEEVIRAARNMGLCITTDGSLQCTFCGTNCGQCGNGSRIARHWRDVFKGDE